MKRRCPDTGDLVGWPNTGDLVEWFETTALVLAKRGIEILVLYDGKKRWIRRDSVEVINASR